jgi:adenine/guanine phosphoribosyltransferase-like PRPP-binding protein
MNIKTHYLESVFSPEELKKNVERIEDVLAEAKIEYDAIAFRGTSGAAVAFPLSFHTGKPLLHVRKSMGHSQRRVEGDFSAKKVIVVDDFSETGRTLGLIRKHIREAFARERCEVPECVAVVFYNVWTDTNCFNEIQRNVWRKFPKAKLFCTGEY